MKPTLPLLLTATAATALALSACKDDQRSAAIAVPEPPPLAEMDQLAALPPAEPAPVRWSEPSVGYSYAERAYDLQRVFYDEPPAYGFDYGGYEPLVWETADDWVMYAEPWEDSYRYYYYAPDSYYPYFVQDEYYGYGFDPTGVLIAVIDATGAYLPAERYAAFAPLAGRYYVRGHDLYSTGERAPRIQVTETVWRERAPKVARSAEPWLRAAQTERGWKEWREKGGGRVREAAAEPRFLPAQPQRQAREFGPPGERAFAGRAAEPRGQGQARREARAFAERAQHEQQQRQAEARGREMRQMREQQARAEHGQRQQQEHGRWAREQQARAEQAQRQQQEHGRWAGEQQGRAEQARRQQQEHGRWAQAQQQARAAEAQGRPAADEGGGHWNHGGGGGNPHQQAPQQAQPQGGGGQGGGNPHGGGQGGQGGDPGKGHGKKG